MKEPVKRKKLAREKTALKVARKWRKAPFSFIFLSFAGGELLTGATYFEKKNENKKRGNFGANLLPPIDPISRASFSTKKE